MQTWVMVVIVSGPTSLTITSFVYQILESNFNFMFHRQVIAWFLYLSYLFHLPQWTESKWYIWWLYALTEDWMSYLEPKTEYSIQNGVRFSFQRANTMRFERCFFELMISSESLG